MYSYQYPRPAVAADIILLTDLNTEAKVLLIQRKNPPFKDCWAFPGGFMDMDETAEEAAVRELEEETGLRDIPVKLFTVASKVDRDPRGRVISVVFYCFVDSVDAVSPVANDDAKDVSWFSLESLPQLAFDHQEIMENLKSQLKEGTLR